MHSEDEKIIKEYQDRVYNPYIQIDESFFEKYFDVSNDTLQQINMKIRYLKVLELSFKSMKKFNKINEDFKNINENDLSIIKYDFENNSRDGKNNYNETRRLYYNRIKEAIVDITLAYRMKQEQRDKERNLYRLEYLSQKKLCQCGAEVSKRHFAMHLKSKKHKDYIIYNFKETEL
jgi:hypothetical protein